MKRKFYIKIKETISRCYNYITISNECMKLQKGIKKSVFFFNSPEKTNDDQRANSASTYTYVI